MKFSGFEECNTKLNIAPVMDRLTGLLNLRYGCDLHFKPLSVLTENEKHTLCSILPKSAVHRNGATACLPITLNSELVGLLEVQDALEVSTSVLHSMREVVSLLVESVYLAANKLESLTLVENQLRSPSLQNSNVISLSHFKARSGIKTPSPLKAKNFTARSARRIPCLLESTCPDDLFKMALEIHEQSDCFAFLNFHHLAHSIRTSSAEVHKLGNVSLFIPDIIKLGDAELFSLIQFLKMSPELESPHIIAGSTLPIRELYSQQLLPSELLKLLNGAFFKIEGSFKNYKQEGVVQHFLDSLKNSISQAPLNI